uniref:Uncharacterized protein n=1 Tax=Arundo donax TaxID=35708 RepID=A0A0A8ZEN3_ARUDO
MWKSLTLTWSSSKSGNNTILSG